ncbi:MAG: FecR domain-containing protein [Pyrinomonadaceae bacterium]
MKKANFWALSIALVLCASCTAAAQNREKFVISAKAGGINAITGRASVHGKGQSEWQQLMVTDDLRAGDTVRTDSDGRVEILLNPGSYLRVGGNSEFELADNSLENLEVRLVQGTAIVEATGVDGTELMINITTPHARIAIVRHGLYRVNVVPGDNTELIVRKGRVILNDSHTKIKGGNKVVFSSAAVTVAKLTKEEKKKSAEGLEAWSKQRAETLAQANRRISDRMLTSAFSSFRGTGFSLFGFSRFQGLWFFNASAGCYTFLPFGFGWGSPYGSSYPISIYFGSRGGIIYTGSNGWPTGGSGTTSGGSTSSGGYGGSVGSGSGLGTGRGSSSAGPRDPDSGQRTGRIITPDRP